MSAALDLTIFSLCSNSFKVCCALLTSCSYFVFIKEPDRGLLEKLHRVSRNSCSVQVPASAPVPEGISKKDRGATSEYVCPHIWKFIKHYNTGENGFDWTLKTLSTTFISKLVIGCNRKA
jgi:hypothetical protein